MKIQLIINRKIFHKFNFDIYTIKISFLEITEPLNNGQLYQLPIKIDIFKEESKEDDKFVDFFNLANVFTFKTNSFALFRFICFPQN
jgi:hypothetical protein